MRFTLAAEFWKQIPSTEPFRVILGDVRDRLYQTRERMRHILSSGKSDIPEDETFTSVDQVKFVAALTIYTRMNIIMP